MKNIASSHTLKRKQVVRLSGIPNTVAVELINKNYPYNIVHYDSSTIDIYGWGNFIFPLSVQGNRYYIAVHHRNAIETWSASSVLLNSTITNYDFTSAKTKAYGNNLSSLGDGSFAIYSGDISDAATSTVGVQDGIIEGNDYADMENAVYYILGGYIPEDITGDGVVEGSDYGLMETNVFYIVFSMHP